MDLTEAAVILVTVGLVVGVPLLGLTLRFAALPLLEAWLAAQQRPPPDSAAVEDLRARVAMLEALLESRLPASPFEVPSFSGSSPRRPPS